MTALNNPSPPYYQADNRLTQSRFTTPILSSLTAALKEPSVPAGVSEECVHRLDGMTECLCKDSEASDWENTVTVLSSAICSVRVCVRGEIILVCFEGAGRTDGASVYLQEVLLN